MRRNADHLVTFYGVTGKPANVLHVASHRDRDVSICKRSIIILYRKGVMEAKEADHRPLCANCVKLGGDWVLKEWEEAPVQQPLLPRAMDEQLPAVRAKIIEWHQRIVEATATRAGREVAQEMERVIKELA